MNGKVRATILLVGILCLVASSALASDSSGPTTTSEDVQ